MADFDLIEADFQQFYHLDVSELGFQRYARLLLQLPAESRFVRKVSPFKDWSWDKEIQSQILHTMDTIAVMYANSHRKKGAQPLKVPPQTQPDYVEKAKKGAKEEKRERLKEDQADLAKIFEKHNSNVNKLEGVYDGTQNRNLLQRGGSEKHNEGLRNQQSGTAKDDREAEPGKS